jgi:hypothetical protein
MHKPATIPSPRSAAHSPLIRPTTLASRTEDAGVDVSPRSVRSSSGTGDDVVAPHSASPLADRSGNSSPLRVEAVMPDSYEVSTAVDANEDTLGPLTSPTALISPPALVNSSSQASATRLRSSSWEPRGVGLIEPARPATPDRDKVSWAL